MLNNLTNWYYPKTVEEALALLKKHEVLPHSAGTMILRTASNRIRGLVDLRRLSLNGLIEDQHCYYIGSCATFSQIAGWDALKGAAAILKQATGSAASTPLRNRITIGGSIAAQPGWSDLPPVLLALDAEIETMGSTTGWFPAQDFFRKSPLDGTSLITTIIVPKLSGHAVFERITRTHFDYSMLDLACYMSITDGLIDKIRVAVGCAVPKAIRLTDTEDMLTGKKPSTELFKTVVDQLAFQLAKDRRASKSYKTDLLKTLLFRSLKRLYSITS